jgi:diguanylate cyclase (GGDEF)-like protein
MDVPAILTILVGLTIAQIVIIAAVVWWMKRSKASLRQEAAAAPKPSAQESVRDAPIASVTEGSVSLAQEQRQAAIDAGVSEEAADLIEHVITTNRVVTVVQPTAVAAVRARSEPTCEATSVALADEDAAEPPDCVTRLPGRRSFQQELSLHFREWMQHRIPLSLLLVEIDQFAELEATGPTTLDEALVQLAEALKNSLPDATLVARYEAAIFGVILAGIDLEAAKAKGEQARSAIASITRPAAYGEMRFTASVGVSGALQEDLQSSFVGRCDSALHAAKENGRNRSYFFEHGKCLPVSAVQIVTGSTESPVERPRPAAPVALDELKRDRRGRRRAPFRQKISIAPYVENRPPQPKDFYQVQCHDISANGISFLFPDPPVHQQFVLILGFGTDAPHVIARVVRTAKLDEDGVEFCLVGCAFCGRLS